MPPKPFERSIFEELPACFAVLQPTDAPWVRAFMIRRLDEMCSHYDAPWQRRRKLVPKPLAEQLKDFQNGLTRFGPEPRRLLSLIDGLIRTPEGNAWLNTNTLFVEGLRQAARNSEPVHVRHDSTPVDQQRLYWLAVSNRINTLAPATPATMP